MEHGAWSTEHEARSKKHGDLGEGVKREESLFLRPHVDATHLPPLYLYLSLSLPSLGFFSLPTY